MLRHLLTRPGGLALAVVVLGLAGLTTSCGGGSGYAAKDMVLVEFLFVDRALVPTAPTGTENLPRNAQILMVFSELVDPGSVNDQTIQIRYGPTGQSVPKGSFSIDGNTVRFDPTVTAQGQPNPFGFEPVTQYLVDIPNFEEQPAVVSNLDADPNLVTFFTTFVTSDGFLRELDAAGGPARLLDPGSLRGQPPDGAVARQRPPGRRVQRAHGPVLVHPGRRGGSDRDHLRRRPLRTRGPRSTSTTAS